MAHKIKHDGLVVSALPWVAKEETKIHFYKQYNIHLIICFLYEADYTLIFPNTSEEISEPILKLAFHYKTNFGRIPSSFSKS